jgi:ubiquinone/menaquinone biosynthesis C-methylase UbiE
VEIDHRVSRPYQVIDENTRLWQPGKGDLVRLRTWDIFERFLPRSGRVLDVGGGPGTHAAHLAARGYEVTLVDPVPHHVERAKRRAGGGDTAAFEARLGTADELPADDSSIDAVLLLGPLYHLVDRADRLAALHEAQRVLRPGGRVLAEAICRHAWVLDATVKGLLDSTTIWDDFRVNIKTGLSQDPARLADGSFWAYFHRPDELRSELTDSGLDDIGLIAVEGFAWLLADLEARMANPEPVLQAGTADRNRALDARLLRTPHRDRHPPLARPPRTAALAPWRSLPALRRAAGARNGHYAPPAVPPVRQRAVADLDPRRRPAAGWLIGVRFTGPTQRRWRRVISRADTRADMTQAIARFVLLASASATVAGVLFEGLRRRVAGSRLDRQLREQHLRPAHLNRIRRIAGNAGLPIGIDGVHRDARRSLTRSHISATPASGQAQ